MHKSLFIFSLLLIFSCNTQSIHSKLTKENNGIKPEDCPVPQKGQNDNFLKGIDKLKNYKWNAITKKATLNLHNKKLIITHGGCIHFIVDAEFHPKEKINLDTNFNAIFEDILWITNILKDFNYNTLKTSIETKDYEIFTNQYVTTITFNNKVLKDNFYAIVVNTKENRYSISQFLQ